MKRADQSRTVFKAAGLVSVLLILSRLVGYVRESLLAARFGATYTMDAYLVAQDLPNVLFAAVSMALVMVFIPVYREVVAKRGDAAAWRLVNTVLNLTLVVAAVLLLVGWVLAPLFVPRLAFGLPPETRDLAVNLTRLILPVLLFMGLSGVAGAVLNANRHFTTPALQGLLTNLPVVLALIVMTQAPSIHRVAWSLVIGTAAAALILVPQLPRLGFRYQAVIDWKDPALLQVGRAILPVLFTTFVIQFQDVVDRYLASWLAEGSISALNYAVRVNSLPYGVVGAALTTVLYPNLAEHAASGRLDELRGTVVQGLRSLAFILLPMVMGLLLFRGPIVQLIFERGAFDPVATASTAYALQFYALGILFFGWQDFLLRCFFALQDTRTPMLAALVLTLLSVGLKVLLVGPLAHGGVALGAGLATVASVGLLLWRLRRRLGGLGGRALLWSWVLSLVTAAAGAVAGYFVYKLAAGFVPGVSAIHQVLRLGAGLGTVVIVHVGLSVLLGNQEGSELAARLFRKLRR